MESHPTGTSHLRASHADRERVIDVLKTAFVQGYLAKDEFDTRVSQTFTSRTYADLAAVTADLPAWLLGAQPPRRSARTKAPESAAIKPGALAAIAGLTVLTAGLWVTMLVGHRIDDDSVKGMLLLLFILTFTDIGMLALTAVVMRESRQRRRADRQLPPATPGAGGQPSRREALGSSAEQLSQVDPAPRPLPECSEAVIPAAIVPPVATASPGQSEQSRRRFAAPCRQRVRLALRPSCFAR
jgi:hypothetical protein